MNSKFTENSTRDRILTAILVMIPVLGMATGNAYAMLAMANIALVAIAIFFPGNLPRHALVVSLAVAVSAMAVALAVSRF